MKTQEISVFTFTFITVTLILCVSFFTVAGSAVQEGLEIPCKENSECESRLICKEGVCGCPLGKHPRFGDVCLTVNTRPEEECYQDEQCYDLFGNHSVCHYENQTSDHGFCNCSENYMPIHPTKSSANANSDEKAKEAKDNEKLCKLTCTKDEDCQKLEKEAEQGSSSGSGTDSRQVKLKCVVVQKTEGSWANGTQTIKVCKPGGGVGVARPGLAVSGSILIGVIIALFMR